jgi:hypothetical protein
LRIASRLNPHLQLPADPTDPTLDKMLNVVVRRVAMFTPVRSSREAYNAYQREFMRKRRAAKRAAEASAADAKQQEENMTITRLDSLKRRYGQINGPVVFASLMQVLNTARHDPAEYRNERARHYALMKVLPRKK